MPKFLQIEDLALNTDHIVTIHFIEVAGSHRLAVEMTKGKIIALSGTKADMFMRWWNDQTDVWNAS